MTNIKSDGNARIVHTTCAEAWNGKDLMYVSRLSPVFSHTLLELKLTIILKNIHVAVME